MYNQFTNPYMGYGRPDQQYMQQPVYQPNFAQYNQNNGQNNNLGQQNAQSLNKNGLQGRTIDSIDVVKSIEIPMDGSISYFALADKSAIVTKQLQVDGTSKTTIYKPIDEEKEEPIKQLTRNDLEEILSDFNKDIKDTIKALKK